MKKSVFFKSSMVLIVGSLLTKGLGLIIRVIFTRSIGSDGINLYSLIMPTYSLLITITQLGLPMAISTLVARGNKRSKRIIISILPIIIILNLLMIAIILSTSKFIAINLLNNKDATYPLMALAAVLPFVSISSILRGYFFGKQKMIPHTISNIVEQMARLIIIIVFLPLLIKKGSVYAVSGFILLSAVSELISIIIFLLYLPKNFSIKRWEILPDLSTTKEVLGLCLPTISGRLIGNLAYFLEPIILTYVLKLSGYSIEFIQSEYGIYNAYVLPLLVIPSFIVQAISTALIPEVSKSYQLRDRHNINIRLRQALLVTTIVSIITNVSVFIMPGLFLKIVYNTNKGIAYIRLLAPFFIIYNMEGPLASVLQGVGKAKEAFRATTIGVVIKTIALALFSFSHIGLYSLLIGEILNILVVVILDISYVKKQCKC